MNKKSEINNINSKGLAVLVYQTWLLNDASKQALPNLSLQKWCNKQLGRAVFPLQEPEAPR